MCLIGDFDHQWKIIPAKAGRVLPLVTIFIETAERDIVPDSVFGRVLLSASLNVFERTSGRAGQIIMIANSAFPAALPTGCGAE